MRLSITKIKAFKACRRLYQLKYIEGLEPVQKSEALETGTNYHALIDQINKGELDPITSPERTKEMAMARAYYLHIHPRFHIVESEKWLEYDLGGDDKLVGIADGIADDGCIVEHKTSGLDIGDAYEYALQWDEQIMAYMLMTGKRKVHYTVIKKPTIRQKKDETAEDFFYRMLDWYEEDTDEKIRVIEIERTDEEVEQFKRDLIDILLEMKIATNTSGRNSYYRNTCHCDKYGQRCEYSSVCLYYDPTAEYIDFIKKEENNGIKKD